MSLFLLSHKSAVGGFMLLEVAIRYLLKLLVESGTRLLYSFIFKLALRDLKFSLQVGVLTKGWGPINQRCSSLLKCRSRSGLWFFCCSRADSLLAWLSLKHVAFLHKRRSDFRGLLGRDAVVSAARPLLGGTDTLILAQWFFVAVWFLGGLFCQESLGFENRLIEAGHYFGLLYCFVIFFFDFLNQLKLRLLSLIRFDSSWFLLTKERLSWSPIVGDLL